MKIPPCNATNPSYWGHRNNRKCRPRLRSTLWVSMPTTKTKPNNNKMLQIVDWLSLLSAQFSKLIFNIFCCVCISHSYNFLWKNRRRTSIGAQTCSNVTSMHSVPILSVALWKIFLFSGFKHITFLLNRQTNKSKSRSAKSLTLKLRRVKMLVICFTYKLQSTDWLTK